VGCQSVRGDVAVRGLRADDDRMATMSGVRNRMQAVVITTVVAGVVAAIVVVAVFAALLDAIRTAEDLDVEFDTDQGL
jgi:hypothetical protein